MFSMFLIYKNPTLPNILCLFKLCGKSWVLAFYKLIIFVKRIISRQKSIYLYFLVKKYWTLR